LPSNKLATTSAVPWSGLVGIVPWRKQQNSEHEQESEDRVDLKFPIVQRKRELTAKSVKLRKPKSVKLRKQRAVHRQCPSSLALKRALSAIVRETSESVTRAELNIHVTAIPVTNGG
jgi:hypothetical protein